MTTSPPGIGDPTAVTPPASVPLGFLSAAAAGLVGFGFVTWFAADRLVTSPTHPGVVSAVHLGVLAFLTMAVLGALHQFGPVVGRRPIRSVFTARISLATMVLAAWLLPNGFAHGPEWMVLAGGLLGTTTVLIVAWNLSAPLSSRDGGVPVTGLRVSVTYLLLTVGFGLVYVLNRRAGWFPLLPNRVLAHAHLGLLGWLGLSYVAVSEKLWPMFLLSHRPSVRSGRIAVIAIGVGVLPLALGLLLAWPVVAWAGGGLVSIGCVAHVVTLASCVRHRRRPLELLHWFLFSSSLFLVIGVGFGALAAVADVGIPTRATLVAAEVAALIAWLALAVIGHSHKIVPFIVYTRLRARGVRTNLSGGPLLFGDLYRKAPAWMVLVSMVLGFGAVLVGIVAASASIAAIGGGLIGIAGIVLFVNLAFGPYFAVASTGVGPLPSPGPIPGKEIT